MNCPYCNAPVSGVYYSTACPSCGKSLHTCTACKFYSPSSHYGCRETVDELVRDKDRPNFCDSFALTENGVKTEASTQAALDKFDSFFNI